MAASSSHIHNTVKDSTFRNISGHVLSTVHDNSTTIHHNYPAAKGPTRRFRGYMPAANDKLFGRDQEIEKIVQILTAHPSSSHSKQSGLVRIFKRKPKSSKFKPIHLALLGAGGQGKTATALNVMAHPAIKDYYSRKNSIWVPCDEATSPELLLDILCNSLANTVDTHNILEAILTELRQTSKPIILLLDNFETPWNAPGARGAVARIIQDIAQLSHVSLFVTMRAPVAPCNEIEWEEMRIQALDPAASRQLFLSIHPQSQEDPKLLELLEMLGHMALAVKLMAQYGKITGQRAAELISGYQTTGTSMLGSAEGSDRLNSVSISISMSLESSLVKNELNAVQLLYMMALLPSGTTFYTLQQWWAQNLENLNGALRVLLEASLLERRTTTYFVLPVIRSYLLDSSHFPTNIHDSMVKAACNFLEHYDSINPGEDSFQDEMQARAIEEINFQAILLQTSESNINVIEALCTLAWHQYRVRPRTEVIQHAVKLLQNVSDQYQLAGYVFHCYASILCDLNHLQQALEQYNLSREAYLAGSEPSLAARELIDIAEVSGLIDSAFNEIRLLEQAQQELESIQDKEGEDWRKTMARCLMLLGQAHSHWDNHLEALEHLTRARDLCSDLPFEKVICAGYLADAHHCLQQFDEAEKWAVLAVNERKQIGSYVGWALWILGRIYISKAEYKLALKSLEEGLQCGKTYGHQENTANILLELGRAQIKMGKVNDAKESWREALSNYGNLEGVEKNKIVCQYYLDKLDDASRVPTSEEEVVLRRTWHSEDIPGYNTVVSSPV